MKTPRVQIHLMLAAGLATLPALDNVANPQGFAVQAGTATAVQNGAQLQITASQNAFLNWQSFNIGAGERTVFQQPSASSIVWNRVNDSNPSQIFGSLEANGMVVLMNSSGFYFGPNSFVSAAGLIVSTAPLGPLETAGGTGWQFNGAPPQANIVNYGRLSAAMGGSIFLIGERIENHGNLTAPEGNIGLLAGRDVLISERPDGRGLSARVTLPEGSVDNQGRLIADAGTIALRAQVVNQGGLIQANSIRERDGRIELIASERINLGSQSLIEASGDATARSGGGRIEIKSEQNYTDSAGSRINVRGGGLGGDGGFVEVSAPLLTSIQSRIDGGAAAGSRGGRLLIDPTDIIIGTTGSGSAGSGTVGADEPPTTLRLNINTAFLGFSQIDLQATRNITLSANTIWDLGLSTGISALGSHLTLEAGNNITLGLNSSILGGPGWGVTLEAGRDFSAPRALVSGVGTISFGANSIVQTDGGEITLRSGNNITLGANAVIHGGPFLGSVILPPGGQLTLEAGNNITVGAGAAVLGGPGWSLALEAGRNFNEPHSVIAGVGNLTLSANATIQSDDSAIKLLAGNNISLGANTAIRGGPMQPTGVAAPGGQLTLEAGINITVGANAAIVGGPGWSLALEAGRNFSAPHTVISGVGNLSFSAGASLHADNGLIHLLAGNNLTLGANATVHGGPDPGISVASPAGQMTFETGNNLIVGAGATILGGPGWTVTLEAGRNFSIPHTVVSEVGTISFSANASLQTEDGGINLLAGNNITVRSGFVRTVGGGSLSATALGGSVNTGTRDSGFLFGPTGYSADPDLGGISTANGGNVTITAGRDIISNLPAETSDAQTDSGSGAFGAAPGNVSLTAGGDVSGHFVVRNGVGLINAGGDAGSAAKVLALSLVSGGWTVNAAGKIRLQEVRNPNGIFNNFGFGSSATKHYFDYSADAYTILNAGNSVELRGTSLPRNFGDFEQSLTPIYPGRLEIRAGAGGVTLGEDIILFPSPLGNLLITTTAGGSVIGDKPGELVQLIVSDSDRRQYSNPGDFGVFDHSAIPVHLGDPTPVRLNISGDFNNILLAVPKRAEVIVGGNMVNSRFDGQNLHDGEVTSIQVAGDIRNRNEFTTIELGSPPDFSVFSRVYPPLNSALASLPQMFIYNAATHSLTFQGRMTGDQLQALLNLQVVEYDRYGLVVTDAQGNPVMHTAQFISADAVQQLYAGSQDIPLNADTGYRIGGGGLFAVSAHNLDLGATVGIVSQGPRANSALANYFTRGADLAVNLTGDLDMFSTTISSVNGGSISVYAGGSINAGSRDFLGDNEVARGIFSVGRSDVTVIAGGNININGSRIAAYDGGNVTVRSLTGDVDAGTGGRGSVPVEKIYVDPVTRRILTYIPTIPGSGILATTFPRPLDPAFPNPPYGVGDILIETPQGDIIANSGGVVQLPLNGLGDRSGNVTLRAGSRDANGRVLYIGNIDASGSGIIGSTVNLDATGDIKGVIVARNNLSISARGAVNVSAFSQGDINVNSGGTISGTLIGIGGISASGTTVDAALLSQNVTTSGEVTSTKVGFAAGTTANATSQNLQNDQTETVLAAANQDGQDDEEQKRKRAGGLPQLTRTTGRVTVLLPQKN